MNINQALKIDLSSFISKLGYEEISRNNQRVFFSNPIRDNDTKASFNVILKDNIWHDFGTDKTGNIVTLIIEKENCSTSEALKIIESICGSQNFIKDTKQAVNQLTLPEKSNFKIVSITNITSPQLIEYLNSRKINIEIAKRFLKQINYNYKDVKCDFFALGFENDTGGYEVRAEKFKSNFINRNITTLKFNDKSNNILVFEGFFDFLSYVTEQGLEALDKINSIIVLSSVGMRKQAIKKIAEMNIKNIFMLFDNNNGGEETTQFFIKNLPQFNCVDKRNIFKEYEDYNDYLKGTFS